MNAVDTETRPYLTVLLAGETCGLSVAEVVEVIEHTAITRVPRTPAWALGVLNLRGAIVPVVDLAKKLGLPASPVSPRTCVVIVERGAGDERRVIGLLADAVDAVVDVDPESIKPPPAFGSPLPAEVLSGFAPVPSGLVPLLDVDRALAAPARLPLHI